MSYCFSLKVFKINAAARIDSAAQSNNPRKNKNASINTFDFVFYSSFQAELTEGRAT